MSIYKSGEDYLEKILMLEEEMGVGQVRSIDVAKALNFSKPSISRGMSLLKDQGYISMGKDRLLVLTPLGRKKAEEIYAKHRALTRYFSEVLHVDSLIAEEDACAIEHVISKESMNAINKVLEKL